MATFQEILQDYVNLSYDQLYAIAKDEFRKFAYQLNEGFDGDNDHASKALLIFVAAILGADGRLTNLEHRFLNDLLEEEFSYEDTCSMVSALGDSQARDLVNELIDAMSRDAKTSALTVALCFCAVDETISRDEVAYFAKLMED